MQRARPSGTATFAAPSRGTSSQPRPRAARAGYSAVKSGDDVKIALSTSSGLKPLACCSARSSSAVASRIASLVFAVAVVAPRSPRRVLLMALEALLRLMVITDAALLKGRDPIEACRRALAGGATMIQVRLKDAAPRDVLTLARALVGALSVPVIVNDRVDVALAANAAGAHLGQEDPPLDRLRPHGPPLGLEGFAALARLAPAGVPVIAIGGITAANAGALAHAAAAGVAVSAAVWSASEPAAATR